jgi:hypothetical protein
MLALDIIHLKTINLAGRWKKQESRTTGYPTPLPAQIQCLPILEAEVTSRVLEGEDLGLSAGQVNRNKEPEKGIPRID